MNKRETIYIVPTVHRGIFSYRRLSRAKLETEKIFSAIGFDRVSQWVDGKTSSTAWFSRITPVEHGTTDDNNVFRMNIYKSELS